jgi:hypothetical protein
VVLWLFVLVPMLISKRDAVRRTSDVALATRVLNSDTAARLLRRSGPAAGHRSDPSWRPSEDADELDDVDDDGAMRSSSSVVVHAAADEAPEPDYLDVDIVEDDSGELPVGSVDVGDEAEPAEAVDDHDDDTYVTDDLDDDSGVEDAADEDDDEDGAPELDAEADAPPTMAPTVSLGASRRRRFDSKTAAAVSARKYAFRKRTLMLMGLVMVLTAAMAFTAAPGAWWLFGSTVTVTALYLGYLRRQTRIEEQVRRRRAQRMARSRAGVGGAGDRGSDGMSSQAERRGVTVLDVDDEDPAFEHLEYASYARDYDWRGDLPRAAGQ